MSPTRGQLGNALKVVWAAGLLPILGNRPHRGGQVIPELAHNFNLVFPRSTTCSIETENDDFYITTDFSTMARELIQ